MINRPWFWPLVMLICIAFVILVRQASAQDLGRCAWRVELAPILAGKYQEGPRGAGLTNGGRAIVELFRAKDDGTWTVIVTNRRGLSCILAAGNDWTEIAPALDFKAGKAI